MICVTSHSSFNFTKRCYFVLSFIFSFISVISFFMLAPYILGDPSLLIVQLVSLLFVSNLCCNEPILLQKYLFFLDRCAYPLLFISIEIRGYPMGVLLWMHSILNSVFIFLAIIYQYLNSIFKKKMRTKT